METETGATLLIDADDTLWESNIYFERVIGRVQEILEQQGADRHGFRESLDLLERKHVEIHGYGTVPFSRSLVDAFSQHFPSPLNQELKAHVRELALAIKEHPLEVLDGVEETLRYLSRQNELYLVTKGCLEEQGRKIADSGLSAYFDSVEILAEKDTRTYRSLAAKYQWNPKNTWMIGNSPRSDINPALAAGLNAVYIPNPNTWNLEHEETSHHPCLKTLQHFSELREHF